MDMPTDYKNGKGSEKHPSEDTRTEAVRKILAQGLRQVESAILLEPMTFRLLSAPPTGAIQTGGEYWIEYKGRLGTF
jgi:hypothetical protein